VEIFGIAIFLAFAALLLLESRFFRIGRQRYRTLRDVAADLSARTGLRGRWHGEGWFSRLESVELEGTLASGRRARVGFFVRGGGKNAVTYVRLVVAADPGADLTVSRETFLTKLGDWLGITHDLTTGSPSFDERFRVHSRDLGGARRAFDRGLRAAISSIFDVYRATDLVAESRELVANVPVLGLEPDQYLPLLEALDGAACAFDRVTVKVRALGGRELRALSIGGAARCAYCHDGITGEEDGLAACGGCRTVLHGACWDELGRCPVLGCGGRVPERARATS
jgi:hypothetical protein